MNDKTTERCAGVSNATSHDVASMAKMSETTAVSLTLFVVWWTLSWGKLRYGSLRSARVRFTCPKRVWSLSFGECQAKFWLLQIPFLATNVAS